MPDEKPTPPELPARPDPAHVLALVERWNALDGPSGAIDAPGFGELCIELDAVLTALQGERSRDFVDFASGKNPNQVRFFNDQEASLQLRVQAAIDRMAIWASARPHLEIARAWLESKWEPEWSVPEATDPLAGASLGLHDCFPDPDDSYIGLSALPGFLWENSLSIVWV